MPANPQGLQHSCRDHWGVQAELTLLLEPDWLQVEYRTARTHITHHLLAIDDQRSLHNSFNNTLCLDRMTKFPAWWWAGFLPFLCRPQSADAGV